MDTNPQRHGFGEGSEISAKTCRSVTVRGKKDLRWSQFHHHLMLFHGLLFSKLFSCWNAKRFSPSSLSLNIGSSQAKRLIHKQNIWLLGELYTHPMSKPEIKTTDTWSHLNNNRASRSTFLRNISINNQQEILPSVCVFYERKQEVCRSAVDN